MYEKWDNYTFGVKGSATSVNRLDQLIDRYRYLVQNGGLGAETQTAYLETLSNLYRMMALTIKAQAKLT
jgi:hypothetical protein